MLTKKKKEKAILCLSTSALVGYIFGPMWGGMFLLFIATICFLMPAWVLERIESFLLGIIGVIASLIAIILGVLGFSWVTSQLILKFFFKYKEEFLVTCFLVALLPLATWSTSPLWGIIFFPAFRFCGPEKEGEDPKYPLGYGISCLASSLIPPWSMYMLRSWWGFGSIMAIVILFEHVQGAGKLELYWGLVLATGLILLWMLGVLDRLGFAGLMVFSAFIAGAIYSPAATASVVGLILGLIWGIIKTVFLLFVGLVWTLIQLIGYLIVPVGAGLGLFYYITTRRS